MWSVITRCIYLLPHLHTCSNWPITKNQISRDLYGLQLWNLVCGQWWAKVLPAWSVVTKCAYLIPHLHICSDWLITKKKKPNLISRALLKVAWSATVSCSDLLENDIKCVYWQDNPTCQVSIFFPKSRFWATAFFVIHNPHWLTVCKVFDTQPNSPYLLFFWKHD